jgi:hypothetical protein
MKKLLLLLYLIPTISFGQIIINQEISKPPPYIVGDTITINYIIKNRTSALKFQYIWFRYDYSNKHIELIPNSTQFLQGQTQNFFHQWIGFRFIPNPNIGVGELDRQYFESGWNYVVDPNWNVVQLAMQKVDGNIDGLSFSQKFIIKDNTAYNNIHKLHLAYALDENNIPIRPIGSEVLWLSLQDVTGLTTSTTLKIAHPTNYPIWEHIVKIYNLENNLIETKQPDSSGEVVLTNLITGQTYYVVIEPIKNNPILDEIVTVSDAYRAFLQIVDKGLFNDSNIFTYPIENIVGNIKKEGGSFNSLDSYYMFAHIIGIDVSNSANIPGFNNQNPLFYVSKLNTYKTGELDATIDITDKTHVFNLGYAWGGDLDFSHSTPLNSTTGGRIKNEYREIGIKFNTKYEKRKVFIEIETEEDLSGLQLIIQYNDQRLKLNNITFNTGNEVVNFITDRNKKISFGSIDQIGKGIIKKGSTYKIEFLSNTDLTSTTGLFYVVLTDGVVNTGEKIKIKLK